ncbi:DUF6932 family protein [Xylophilus sp. ASV27]|uniref:DUF6932 family protein n=1 Tax=Xylophilus sp. ASV27 TaxID=2795129 RepID=UPI0018ED78BA|nr:hypothetical protein [Xylophilus sp. ASV27]
MIPSFNHSHVLPPFLGSDPSVAAQVSPFVTSMRELVERFCHLEGRRALLDGLLKYRAELARLGFLRGFQWIDGSFVEDVEVSEKRAPNDIDVVTFSYAPAGLSSTQVTQLLKEHPQVFQPEQAKATFRCDPSIVPLDKSPENLVKRASYYFNLFSHRRGDHVWKGLLQIPLESDGVEARELLENAQSGGRDVVTT